RAPIEDKREDLKANDSMIDVLTHAYGRRNEIAELFFALARAAGFEADLLRASDRTRGIFDVKLLSAQQLEVEIVRVQMNGQQLYFDPGTKYCPFGIVTWSHTSTPALKRSEEHTSELQSRFDLVCRLLLEKKQRNT